MKQKSVVVLIAFLSGVYLGMHIAVWDDVREDLSKCQRQVDTLGAAIEISTRESKALHSALHTLQNEYLGSTKRSTRFGRKVTNFATGAVRAPKDEFMRMFDFGMPLEIPQQRDLIKDDPDGSDEVLVLYPNTDSLPSRKDTRERAVFNDANPIPRTSVAEATANCENVNVVYMKGRDRCLALLEGPGAHHILRWRKGSNASSAFVRVGLRGEKGRFLGLPHPKEEYIHRSRLRQFLGNLDNVLTELKPILERIAVNNAVVIMTVNEAYTTMAANFVCSSRARGLDLSNLLMFASDDESFAFFHKLGIEVFHMRIALVLPTEKAQRMGDNIFAQIAYAQMVSVFLVNTLGYDVLFQDADVVWFKNPLELFHNLTNDLQHFDVIFMDDGAAGWEYVPFRANTGFFYVRQNERSRYLFSQVLFSGDLFAKIGVDQVIMGHLLNEISARHGLRVKTLDYNVFPGGRQYHREKSFVNGIIDAAQEESTPNSRIPWMFHMHWTATRDIKLEYMRQSGMWYVTNECARKKGNDTLMQQESDVNLKSHCCSPKPIISCHHPDKPSVKFCRENTQ